MQLHYSLRRGLCTGLLLVSGLSLGLTAQAQYTFTKIVDNTTSAPTGTFSSFGNPSISGGTVAFSGFYNGFANSGIFTGNGGALTPIVKDGDTAPIDVFTAFGNPSISGGTTAFAGSYNGGANAGIFTGNGGTLTTVVQSGDTAPIGTFTTSFSRPSISGGTVAFLGDYNGGLNQGIFTKSGGALTNVLLLGDSLFGSTVSNLNIGRLDDTGNGSVSFQYNLADGSSGIGVASLLATSTPEPGVFALLGALALPGLGLCLRRRAVKQRVV